MIYGKKAQVEIQFNWMYILIVGAVIFAMIFGFVMKQKNATNIELSYSVVNNLKSIFLVSKAGIDSSSRINLYNMNLDYSCIDGFSSIRIDRASSEIGGTTMFAPPTLNGEELTIWSRQWFVPYKVDNFLYVSSPKTHFYFMYDGNSNKEFAEKIQDMMPSDFDVTISDELRLSSVENQNYDNFNLIFLGVTPDSIKSSLTISTYDFSFFGDTKVNVIAFDPTKNTDNEIGTIYFVNTSNNIMNLNDFEQSKYLGHAMMFGALFSANKDNYECSMSSAFSRLEKINELLFKRTKFLQSRIGRTKEPITPIRCDSSVGTLGYLSEIEDSLFNINVSINTNKKVIPFINSITSHWSNLKKYNSKLEDFSCPLLY